MPVLDAKTRFGPFELDARTGELRSNGTRIKLQGQPISVLQILLETPGELVTREQIRERLWSSDTFVDFDHNLNTAIKKLRQALGDEAETPRYIETIPRYGYRFIGQVEKNAAPEAAAPRPGTGEGAAGPAPGKDSRLRRALPWALCAAALLLAAYFAFRPVPRPNVIEFTVPAPDNSDFVLGGESSISPDGRNLAFITSGGPGTPDALWVRPLDSLIDHRIPGTEGAAFPFWSPDSQQIGFFANGKLKKAAVWGGAPQVLCDAVGTGTWNRDGVILFDNRDKLYRVPDSGGTSTLVLAPDPALQGVFFIFPQFLPDGRHFLFRKYQSLSQQSLLEAGSLDSKEVVELGPVGTHAFYAAPGYILYLDQGWLMARPFNASVLRFTGPAAALAPNITPLAGQSGYFSVSNAGVLAYQPSPGLTSDELSWISRAGQKLGTVGEAGMYSNPAVSPDGSRVAVGVGNPGQRNIWVYDLKRGTDARFTFSSADDTGPIWTADGSRIFFSSTRGGNRDIYEKAATGQGGEQLVFHSFDQTKYVNDVTPDGRYAIYDTGIGRADELWTLPLLGDGKPAPFVQGGYGAHSASFSPDGRFVAYASSETGRMEIYVETFPQRTGKWQISSSGGAGPSWRRDGKELYYLAQDGQLMAVPVDTDGASIQPGVPKALFPARVIPISIWRNIYAPAPDGQRFLMLTPAGEAKPQPITVVVNWPLLLKK